MRTAFALLLAAVFLGGCGSSRFGDRGPSPVAARPAPVFNAPAEEPVATAVPSGSVTAEPLPPPPGAGGVVADEPGLPPPGPPGPGPVVADVPSPAPVEVIREERRPAAAAAGSGRFGVVGGWTAREATGATCRVQLASTAALDLYKASAANCANRDLSRVTAWDFRDGEVFLYQPGGAVAARLRENGGGLEGVLAKSGAPLSLSR
jgi:hypothetical protein